MHKAGVHSLGMKLGPQSDNYCAQQHILARGGRILRTDRHTYMHTHDNCSNPRCAYAHQGLIKEEICIKTNEAYPQNKKTVCTKYLILYMYTKSYMMCEKV